MRHFASLAFWEAYRKLPENVRSVADKTSSYSRIIRNTRRCSSSALDDFGRRVPRLHYRALAVDVEGGLRWFWIGAHADYDAILKG